VELAQGEPPARAIARALRARHGLRLARGRVVASVSHAILDARLTIDVVAATIDAPPRRTALRWVAPSAIGEVATSGATTKIARAVLSQKRSHAARTVLSSSGSSGRAKA
jgi:hypothetical protein